MPFLIVLGSGAFILGLAYIIWISVVKHRSQGTPNWPKVTGTIVRARVYAFEHETPQGIKRTYTPLVSYTYEAGGQVYTAVERNVLPYYQATHDKLQTAEDVVAQYPVGSEVPIYYNPANPKQSLLELPKPAAHNAVLYFGLANALMGA
ncbi:MAG: DUF3592 domain-containing protein, partial [Anaerolineae bacterium]